MKEALTAIKTLAEKIKGGMDSSAAEDLKMEILKNATVLDTIVFNRTRER